MSNYDFKSLSSYDFENLTRDLLQKEFNILLESFKTGRDGGIDLRYSSDKNNTLIVQCKHYSGSTYSSFISNLKKKEVSKVMKLEPSRYIIVTSLGLTPQNKDEIQNIFSPFIISKSDIFSCEDINNLLGRYPEIERLNYKLWLTSFTILDKIINSKLYNQSEIALNTIQRKSMLYVQNSSYHRAHEILKEMNYCIISGVPGIGKTTLAEILLIYFIDNDYEIFKISNDIGEAYSVFNSLKKQVFYYDDFLGQTSLHEKLHKNEDQLILDFIDAIKRSPHSKFLLTTREYILNQAKSVYGKLARSNFDFNKCTIDLADYTKFDKAKILFNHIYFSNLPSTCKDEILKNKNYMRIINHRNYNPRIIEEMTNTVFCDDYENYTDSIVANLDNPSRIWEHVFDNQISIPSKNLLILLVSFGRENLLKDVEISFRKFHAYKSRIFGTPLNQDDFKKALKELDGNFIKSNKHSSQLTISFSNPSIRDFMENYLCSNQDELLYLSETSDYFEQSLNLFNYKLKELNGDVTRMFTEGKEFVDGIERNLTSESVMFSLVNMLEIHMFSKVNISIPNRLYTIIDTIKEFEEVSFQFIDSLFSKFINNINSFNSSKSEINLLIKLINKYELKDLFNDEYRISILKKNMTSNLNTMDDYNSLIDFISYFPHAFTEFDIDKLNERFSSFYKNDVDEILEEDNILALEEYLLIIENVGSLFEIDVFQEIERINERIYELEEENVEPDYDDDRFEQSNNTKNLSEDNLIDNLFDSLIN